MKVAVKLALGVGSRIWGFGFKVQDLERRLQEWG